jgi:REP element-mobilizing transposase RayT
VPPPLHGFPSVTLRETIMLADLPRRINLRHASHDYTSPGNYFITICTAGRRPILGWLESDGMHLSRPGVAVQNAWDDLLNHRASILLDQFIIMPDHVHGIITLLDTDRTTDRPSLGSVIGGYKSAAARQANIVRNMPGAPVWQRGYYDRILFDSRALQNARRYIAMNPERAIQRMLAGGLLRT